MDMISDYSSEDDIDAINDFLYSVIKLVVKYIQTLPSLLKLVFYNINILLFIID
jgi:hypothetical protein